MLYTISGDFMKGQGKKGKKNYPLLISLYGILSALAICLSYLENLVPQFPFFPPGAKLGMSNVVILLAILFLGVKGSLFIFIAKSVFALLTGGTFAFLIGFAGGAGAFVISAIILNIGVLYKKGHISLAGVSMLSAAAFNILQLAAAVYVTGTDFFAAYLPFMLFASVVSGLITGIVLNLSAPAIEKYASLNRLFI